MKRQLLLSLTLSLLAANTFAMPASEQAISAEAKPAPTVIHHTVAEGGPDRLIEQPSRVADSGSARLIQQYQRVAESGSDRLIEQHQRVS
jgi:hypothetical protein